MGGNISCPFAATADSGCDVLRGAARRISFEVACGVLKAKHTNESLRGIWIT